MTSKPSLERDAAEFYGGISTGWQNLDIAYSIL